MRAIRLATLVTLLGSAAVAQTYVVDGHNGPGTHFTSIAAAVAAVPDGAVLLVRPATYAGFEIVGKSLTVLGEPGAHVDFLIPPMTISGLGPTQSVELRGLSWSNPLAQALLSCSNCRGRILIEACRSDESVAQGGGGVVADRCDQLHIRDCVFGALGRNGLSLSACNAMLLDSDVRATGFFYAGIDQLGGTLQVARSRVAGAPAAPSAIRLNGGTLVVRGGSTLVGDPLGSGLVIDGTGVARVDPNTVLVPPGAGVGAGISLSTPSMPFVTASTQSLGGVASATFTGPNGTGVGGALLAGFPAAPRQAAPFLDPIWLDPARSVVVAVGGARLAASYAVPSAPWARGVVIGWQGFSLIPSTGVVQASNPAVYVHW